MIEHKITNYHDSFIKTLEKDWYELITIYENKKNMNETWENIQGYEGLYMINKQGHIKSFRGKNIKYLKPVKAWFMGKYNKIGLYKNRKCTQFYIHKLVLSTFVGTKGNKYEVNHIDGNTKNNSLDNLEWVTRSENLKHSYSVLWRKAKLPTNNINFQPRKVAQYSMEWLFIKKWDSVSQAASYIWCSPSCITSCCKWRRNTGYNFIWEYLLW